MSTIHVAFPHTPMKPGYPSINLDSDSSEEVHPNIDERSYKNWKRQQREQKRKELEQRLQMINSLEHQTEETLQEREKLENLLKPQYKCIETESFRVPAENKDKDYIEELEYLVEHDDLNSFIELMDRNMIEMEELEYLILHNLAEQIKEGNEVGGLILTKLSLYAKYAISHGKGFLIKLNAQLTDKEKKRQFEIDCRKDFEETKKSFLEYFK